MAPKKTGRRSRTRSRANIPRHISEAVVPTPFKLQIELVPSPLWETTLRSKHGLGKNRWTKLRSQILNELGPCCAICGSEDHPHGHEVWEYLEKRRSGIAKVVRVEIICRRCHAIHHWGLTLRLIENGMFDAKAYRGLIKHFLTVNGCRKSDFDKHEKFSFHQWEERSAKRWKVDWGDFSSAIDDAEAARKKWRKRKRWPKLQRRVTPIPIAKPRQNTVRVFLTTKKMIAEYWQKCEQQGFVDFKNV